MASATIARAAEVVRLGVTAGPHAQIAEVARKVAARDGLEIRIVEFQDYIQPDAALDSGELDANSYQHLPKGLQIVQLEAAQLARSPYANRIAVRTADKDKPWVTKLVNAYQSPAVRAYVSEKFAGSMVPEFCSA